jgi:hypothetical protein
MFSTQDLKIALEMLTEGSSAPITESFLPEALEIQKSAKPWTMDAGIQGLGIGRRVTQGKEEKDLALKVYVEKKLPKNKIDCIVPPEVNITSLKGSIPTDVEAIGRVEIESNISHESPALPGFSVGHPKINAGTYGSLVRKKGQKTPLYILSNSHVLANSGIAKKGDKIIYPGTADGGKLTKDVIGTLEEWIDFEYTTESYPNLVDAAISSVKKTDVKSAIHKIGVPLGISKVVRIGTKVQKTGRTTDYTIGIVRDVNYRFHMRYKKVGGGKGRVGFRDQVLCTRYTAGGDSGSAVLNMQKKVVGLHFAGSPSSSIFSKIQHVIDLLDIEFVTEDI